MACKICARDALSELDHNRGDLDHPYTEGDGLTCNGSVFFRAADGTTQRRNCGAPASRINADGFLYCDQHKRGRKLRPSEILKLERGEQLARY